MIYVNTVKIIFNILISALGVFYFHFIIFAIVGLFKKKRYPKTDKRYEYGMIIPARNEESVVAGLIDSIKQNDYPQDKIKIFVIAHNCTDRTAEVARAVGAIVYEYNNPEENTMGYAFRYLFSKIEEDYGTQNFDGFFLFNADNILDRSYISKMNDAFDYFDKKCVITSFRNSKNFGTNIISGLYGMYFAVGCRMESCGRTVLGVSTRVQGTGYLINSEIVKNGWPYVSLTEDWEFTADQILAGNNVRYCDEAVFFDEQPTSLHIMWRQRVRWSRGHLLVFYARIKDLFSNLFKRNTAHKISLWDITANVIPLALLLFFLNLLQYALLLVAPLFEKDVTYHQLLFGSSMNPFFSDGLLPALVGTLILSYVSTLLTGCVMFFAERKRIKNVSKPKMILIALLWPVFFVGIQFPIDVQAFFSRNLGWKPIPHEDQTTFELLND